MTEYDLFNAAIKLTANQRSAFLDAACVQNAHLRQQVEALLRAHVESGGLLPERADQQHEATRVAASQAAPGMLIAGRYKLREQVGEGGMGTVWAAEQLEPVRRRVAVKLIKPGMDSRQVLSRFEAERQALALMDHPNIARVFDGGMTDEGRPFFVMEYVKGLPITQYCDDTRLTVAERLGLFTQVCQAVQHAHQKGIIHRDLKPSNILVCLYDGQPVPKVIDFGLVKAMHQPLTEHTLYTAHGLMVGTPLYMSPEQAEANNLDIDTRSDVYSLGVILYELLTGTTPLEKQRFKEAAWQEMLRLIKEEEPPKPSTRLSGSATLPTVAAQRKLEPMRLSRLVRGELDWIVMKSLEKDRSRRYETASGLALDVQRYLTDEPVLAGPPSVRYRVRKLVRRNRGAVITAGVVLLALVGGIVGTWLGLIEARRQRDVAEAARADEARQRDRAETARADESRQRQVAVEQRSRATAAERAARDEARRAGAINQFLLDDVFYRRDPDIVGPMVTGVETLEQLLDRTAVAIPRAFPDDPAAAAKVQQAIGDTYHNVNRMEKSEAQLREAYKAHCRLFGVNSLEAWKTAPRLAHILAHLNRIPEALELLRPAEAGLRRILGPDDPLTVEAVESLGLAWLNLNRRDEGLPLLEEAQGAWMRRHGPDHITTMRSSYFLGTAYAQAGQWDKAVATLEPLVPSRRRVTGPLANATLFAIEALASAYNKSGRFDAAEPLWREAFGIRTKVAPQHWQTPSTGAKLGDLLARRGNLAEAESLLVAGYEGMKAREKALPATSRDRLTNTIDRLIELYTSTNKPDEVQKWQAERAKYPEIAPPPRENK